ncbi:MAG: Dehydrosqualene desaturase [candidate division WS6 bacterium OLB21]|uniref:Dehydrosqualene desaturase n=1 Tax=candidate division WS6 bacterium OLB21 TaxID=1617427 RepID=A0A136KFA6_9BACT|nr:MAG: Dehydrosqualene desaturase [candidate division WS6 bacterium OLB21]
MKTKHIVVIGAGYGGLSAAALLAHKGYKVTVLEKHNQPGGRARLLEDKGFKFDIGPSWYMMPEMFDRLFSLTNKNREDYYKIKRLDPSYRIFFNQNDSIDIPSNADQVGDLFETLEKGSKQQLERYLADAKYKYDMATKEFLYKRFSSIFSLLDRNLVLDPAGYDILKNFHKHTKNTSKTIELLKLWSG